MVPSTSSDRTLNNLAVPETPSIAPKVIITASLIPILTAVALILPPRSSEILTQARPQTFSNASFMDFGPNLEKIFPTVP